MKGRPKFDAEMRRQLEAIDKIPDDQIDTSDIPEMKEEDFNKPHYIGLIPRPGKKKSITIRLDADVVDWFKAHGKGWQTEMNWALRLYYASHRKTGAIVGKP